MSDATQMDDVERYWRVHVEATRAGNRAAAEAAWQRYERLPPTASRVVRAGALAEAMRMERWALDTYPAAGAER